MAVYVDSAIWAWAGCRWCHLLADDLDELHRLGAVVCDRQQIVVISRRARAKLAT
jgi:hypothetical protein